MRTYKHLLEINEQDRQLTIYRVFADGRRDLFTEMHLPEASYDESPGEFSEFCRMLGENLLIDSPIARNLLGL